jgi:hypothetical protein
MQLLHRHCQLQIGEARPNVETAATTGLFAEAEAAAATTATASAFETKAAARGLQLTWAAARRR